MRDQPKGVTIIALGREGDQPLLGINSKQFVERRIPDGFEQPGTPRNIIPETFHQRNSFAIAIDQRKCHQRTQGRDSDPQNRVRNFVALALIMARKAVHLP